MASVTSSHGRNRLAPLAELAGPLVAALERRPAPLLVLRLPDFARIAWRDGKRAARSLERRTARAFLRAVRPSLRAGDLLGHDPGSDLFVIVMTAAARAGQEVRVPSPLDCRSVLERAAAAVSLTGDLRIEIGWTLLRRYDAAAGLERELESALERGARERERYEFLAAIGHELRTPLTAIRGYIETLLDDPVDAATSRRFLQTARREALRLGRLLEGMFEFSLLDLCAQSLSQSTCDLAEQAIRARDALAPLARSRRIRVELNVPGGISLIADADACMQTLVNLLDNAVKYGREGGRVLVAAACDQAGAHVWVDDDGPGIVAGERESIFGLRVRGAQASRRPGTGIGLAIVKTIVERLGGEVRVCDSPLGGARFELDLPARAESAACVS